MNSQQQNTLLACPCCGHLVVEELGQYEICPICYWEDDPLQSEKPDLSGGANQPSLRQAQHNYLDFRASAKELLSNVRDAKLDELKDDNWKPL